MPGKKFAGSAECNPLHQRCREIIIHEDADARKHGNGSDPFDPIRIVKNNSTAPAQPLQDFLKASLARRFRFCQGPDAVEYLVRIRFN